MLKSSFHTLALRNLYAYYKSMRDRKPDELIKDGLIELGLTPSTEQINAFITYLFELKNWKSIGGISETVLKIIPNSDKKRNRGSDMNEMNKIARFACYFVHRTLGLTPLDGLRIRSLRSRLRQPRRPLYDIGLDLVKNKRGES